MSEIDYGALIEVIVDASPSGERSLRELIHAHYAEVFPREKATRLTVEYVRDLKVAIDENVGDLVPAARDAADEPKLNAEAEREKDSLRRKLDTAMRIISKRDAALAAMTQRAEAAERERDEAHQRASDVLDRLKAAQARPAPEAGVTEAMVEAAVGALEVQMGASTPSPATAAIYMRAVLSAVLSARPEPASSPARGVETLLREVLDKGLIYWEPNTPRGHVAKADMIARCEAALSSPPPRGDEDLRRAAREAVEALKEASFKVMGRGRACPMFDEPRKQLEVALAPRGDAEGWRARPLSEWHEDMGGALWWRFPVTELPYSGSPLDVEWPGYHTHFTPICAPPPPATTGDV